jgi:hypothetical protein
MSARGTRTSNGVVVGGVGSEDAVSQLAILTKQSSFDSEQKINDQR